MALTPIKTKYVDGYKREVTERGEPTYVGRVLCIWSREERIMSDVWDNVSYATVLKDNDMTEDIHLGASSFGWNYECDVDATPEMISAWQERGRIAAKAHAEARAIADALHRAQAAEEHAKAECLIPIKGYPAKVVKGRKVPVGTEGMVVWTGEGGFGTRIGICDEKGTTHYTAADNVVRSGLNRQEGEMWLDTWRRLRDDKEKAPTKWDLVRLPDMTEGTVFWINEARIGITTTNRKVGGKYVDVVWTSAGEVTVIERRETEPPFVNADTKPTPKDEPAPF